MDWLILVVLALIGVWVVNANRLNVEASSALATAQHEEQMAYMRYLKDQISYARTELRKAAGLPDGGDELLAKLRDTGILS